MLVPIPFIGPSATGRSIAQNAERTLNLYPEPSSGNPKVPFSLVHRPGLSGLLNLPDTVRCFGQLNDRLFALAGPGIYEINQDATYTLWGTINTLSGKAWASRNGNNVIFGDGTGFYVFNPYHNTIVRVTASGTPIAGTFSAYINGYTLYAERGTQKVWFSDLEDPSTVNGLAFESAEGDPDDLFALAVVDLEVILLGQQTTEFWAPTGDQDTPFERVSGGFIQKGTASPWTVRNFEDSLIFVDNTPYGGAVVRQIIGYDAAQISTPAVDHALSGQDATTFTAHVYSEQGRSFYVLNTPNGTWAYDAKGGWCERSWLNPVTGQHERARPEFFASWHGAQIVSDYAKGTIYGQSLSYLSDDGVPRVCLRRTGHVDLQGRPAFYDKVWFDFEVGVGLDGVGQGTDPQVMFRFSPDGGRSWGKERFLPLGKIGETRARVIVRRVGRALDAVFEVSVSDAVKVTMLQAFAEVRLGV